MINRTVILSIAVVLLLAGILFGSQQFATADGEEVEAIASGPKWKTPVQISTTGLGGKLPTVAAAPNGRSVMIAYLREFASAAVPYYRESNNNGDSWGSSLPVGSNGANETGVAIDLAFDGTGNAHALWTTLTDDGVNPVVHKIYYARENNWPSSNSFSSATNPGLIINPAIATRGSNVVLVWAENVTDTITDIYYRFSTANGSGMTVKAIVRDTINFSRKPDIAIGSNNKIHLVWQEGDSGGLTSILYSEGTIQGSTINWSNPITLAVGGSPPDPTRSETLTPQIEVRGNRVFVSYTRWGNISQEFSQSVEFRQCNSNCSIINNWQSSEQVSGQLLGITTNNPFIVKSTTANIGNCSYVYFHGIPIGETNPQIWGVNSCDSWFANGRDEITPQSESAINPRMTSQNNWLLYLVYEKVADDADRTRTVWFVGNDPGIFLPVTIR